MTDREQTHHHPNYVAVWVWLVLLVIMSVLISSMPVAHSMALLLVFEVAVIKALLVAVYFMHLKFERPFIYSLVIVPLVFFAILVFVLFPDIAFHEAAAMGQQSTAHP